LRAWARSTPGTAALTLPFR